MHCASVKKLKRWVIYDAKDKIFLHLTSDDFRDYITNNPIKLVDRKIFDRVTCKKIWIDGIINSAYFK